MRRRFDSRAALLRDPGVKPGGDEIVGLRPPLPADLPGIAALVSNLIPRHIGGSLTTEGLADLRTYMWPGIIGARLTELVYPPRNPALVAVPGSRIVGYGAVRYLTHISQVYVVEDWHRRGVGSALITALIDAIRRRDPARTAVTLNATPRAIPLYFRLGFETNGPARAWHGAVSHPMLRRLI